MYEVNVLPDIGTNDEDIQYTVKDASEGRTDAEKSAIAEAIRLDDVITMGMIIVRPLKAQLKQEMSLVDGITVIWIDTPDLPEDKDGPRIRVYLNDDAIFENPVFPGQPVERE